MTVFGVRGTGASDEPLTWRIVRGSIQKSRVVPGVKAPRAQVAGAHWRRDKRPKTPDLRQETERIGSKTPGGGRKVALLNLDRDPTAAIFPILPGSGGEQPDGLKSGRGAEK
jgi:hypothetical protein